MYINIALSLYKIRRRINGLTGQRMQVRNAIELVPFQNDIQFHNNEAKFQPCE